MYDYIKTSFSNKASLYSKTWEVYLKPSRISKIERFCKTKFSRKNCFETEAWLLLTFSIYLHIQLSSEHFIVALKKQMFEQGYSSNSSRKKKNACFLKHCYSKIWVVFCFKTGKHLVLDFASNRKSIAFSKKCPNSFSK